MKTQRLLWQFVITPFLPEHQPALGVSSLLAVLRRDGFTGNVRYLNIEFGERIGWVLNSTIENRFPKELLVGESLFTPALWGDAAPSWGEISLRLESFCDALDSCESPYASSLGTLDILNQLRYVYDESCEIVRGWAKSILRNPPRIVGLSSTFQQNVASLALAKELRRHLGPEELLIVFGGANCESDMGRAIADNFSFVDHVISGESEALIRDIAESVSDAPIGGGSLPRFILGSPVMNLNDLPLPDCYDYFSAISDTEWANRGNLAAESSRGCWWGAKSHCTFCGLNGNTMAFRSKRPERLIAELRNLKKRHGSGVFMMADNIMDMKYLTSLLPELVSSGENLRLFYETKANLRKDQLETMAAAGVVWIQPGIESLSTPILRLMGKGTTFLQNLQLLKWAEEFEMRLSWNILFGFPNEPILEYSRVAALLKNLFHLPAPTGFCRIRMDRFSPYWRSPESHGLRNVRHASSYDLVYPCLSESERERLAYFFEFEYGDNRDPEQYSRALSNEVDNWRGANIRKATLEWGVDGGVRSIMDSRESCVPYISRLSDAETVILSALDSHCNADLLLRRVFGAQLKLAEPKLLDLVERFIESGWVIRDGDQLLSVVLDRTQCHRVIDRQVAARLEYFGLSANQSESSDKMEPAEIGEPAQVGDSYVNSLIDFSGINLPRKLKGI